MNIDHQIPDSYKKIASFIEWLLALIILCGVLVFGISSMQTLFSMDWHAAETFYEMIHRLLLLVIGVELARTLVTHDLRAILELLAFVIARKILKPDLDVMDILLSVFAFVALLAAGHYWLSNPTSSSVGKQ